jgi:hypothetical protein
MKRYQPRNCQTCDKKVELTFVGTYRRHFAIDPSGRRRLCPSSGRIALTPAEAEADAAVHRRRADWL